MMPGFLSTPKLDFREPGAFAVLLEDLTYIDRRSRRHTAHRGEITDGGSIPRFFWRVAGPPFQSPLLPAYIIHDHYCTRAADLKKDWPAEYHQLRLEGDELLREMAEVLGASRIKCWYLYRAVRIGATV